MGTKITRIAVRKVEEEYGSVTQVDNNPLAAPLSLDDGNKVPATKEAQ